MPGLERARRQGPTPAQSLPWRVRATRPASLALAAMSPMACSSLAPRSRPSALCVSSCPSRSRRACSSAPSACSFAIALSTRACCSWHSRRCPSSLATKAVWSAASASTTIFWRRTCTAVFFSLRERSTAALSASRASCRVACSSSLALASATWKVGLSDLAARRASDASSAICAFRESWRARARAAVDWCAKAAVSMLLTSASSSFRR
mmetsp:Transcript_26577/g.76571  ORF Transcript_26577/g.76571 Transcript_26577/m.76571 type:complete len:209 (+) Transcript_26577:556-1182(+)